MRVIIKHDVDRIKNGYCARCPTLGLAAHGYSPEVAKRNLERSVVLFFRPFEREGVVELENELKQSEVRFENDGGELAVTAED